MKKKTIVIILSLLIVLVAAFFIFKYNQAQVGTNTYYAIQDTTISQDDSYSNQVNAGYSSNTLTYVFARRTDVNDPNEDEDTLIMYKIDADMKSKLDSGDYKISDAYLSLYVYDKSSGSKCINTYTTSTSWTETTATWNNAPQYDTLISTCVSPYKGTWSTFPLDSAILQEQIRNTGDLKLSYRLKETRKHSGENELTEIRTKEYGQAPRLYINIEPYTILVYRYENNECNLLEIPQSQRTSNDYGALYECQNQIISQVTFYRLENNQCTEIQLYPSEKTSNDYYTATDCYNQINIPQPDTPAAPGWSDFLSAIWDWVKNIFGFGGVTQTIYGETSPLPGSTHTYNISISTTQPDSTYNDGSYSVQYANWALVESGTQSIIKQGTWEQVYGEYDKSVTITLPNTENKEYALLGIITETQGTYDYNTGTWTFSEEQIKNKEAINVKTLYSITEPTNPEPSGFSKLISDIINWIKNFLGL